MCGVIGVCNLRPSLLLSLGAGEPVPFLYVDCFHWSLMSSPSWQVLPTCGVEARGLRLGQLTPEQARQVQAQFDAHGVVFFRDVGEFATDDHVAFASHFGQINVNRFFEPVEANSAIAKVEKLANQVTAVGELFHTDHSYDLEPALGSVLVAKQLPQTGGDTVFVDMRKAYDSLPESLKAQIVGLRAVHSSRQVFGKPREDQGTGKSIYHNAHVATQDTVHPVVIVHPRSGRKTLYVNPSFTIQFEGKTPEESQPLLQALYHHAVQSCNMTRFHWEQGSVAMWDNRAVWHCAMNDYQGEYRLMHRVTIDGCKLVAADDASKGSEPYHGEVPDVLVPRYPRTVMDLPYVMLQLQTVAEAMRNLDAYARLHGEDAPPIKPWWPEIKWYHTVLLKAMGYLGMHPRL